MATDYISREAAIDAVCGDCEYNATQDCEECRMDRLVNIPPADVRPVVHGEWTTRRTLEHDGEWWCTACGEGITIYMGEDRADRYNFCPHCGADMRKEKHEQKP